MKEKDKRKGKFGKIGKVYHAIHVEEMNPPFLDVKFVTRYAQLNRIYKYVQKDVSTTLPIKCLITYLDLEANGKTNIISL